MLSFLRTGASLVCGLKEAKGGFPKPTGLFLLNLWYLRYAIFLVFVLLYSVTDIMSKINLVFLQIYDIKINNLLCIR
jgi:hypothetical protein